MPYLYKLKHFSLSYDIMITKLPYCLLIATVSAHFTNMSQQIAAKQEEAEYYKTLLDQSDERQSRQEDQEEGKFHFAFTHTV